MTTFIRVRSAEGPTGEYFVSDAQLAARPDDYVVIDPAAQAPTVSPVSPVDAAPAEVAPAAEVAPEPSVGDSNEEGAA